MTPGLPTGTNEADLSDESPTVTPNPEHPNGTRQWISDIRRDQESSGHPADGFMEAAADGVVVFDTSAPHFPIVDCNSALCALSGYAREQLLGRACDTLFGDTDDPAAIDALRRCLSEQREEILSIPLIRGDGSAMPMEIHVSPPTRGSGELQVTVAICRDVADRAQNLELSEARFQAYYRHHPVPTYIWKWTGETFVLLDANDAAATITHGGVSELIGNTMESLYSDDPEMLRHFRDCFQSEQTTEREFWYTLRSTGERKFIVASFVFAPPDWVIVHTQDFTDRKIGDDAKREAEDRYRSIFMNAEEGIFQSSRDGKLLSANPSLARIYGYDTPEEIMAEVTDIASSIYVDPLRRAEFMRQLDTEGAVSNMESQVFRRDHSIIWISTSARAVRDADGAWLHCEGFVQDVTERKRLEAEQQRALAEARERADRDPLTGLLNHRSFQKKLNDEATRAKRDGTVIAVVVLDMDNFKFFNDVYGHSTGDNLLTSVARRLIAAGRYDVVARYGGDEFALLMRNVGDVTLKEIEARVHADLRSLGYRPEGQETAIPINASCGVALYPHGAIERAEVLHRAEERLRLAKTGGASEADEVRTAMLNSVAGFSMLDALVTAVDNKDRYTRKHSDDVMEYSLMIGRELGLDQDVLNTIAVAALLHDVGKIGVPDFILRKPGKLTPEEFDAIKQHPQMGAIMVSAVPGLEATLDAVRHHHERWDGHGYPFGLVGTETPLIARLMAVADAYSAMTTDRPYRKGMDRAKALSILKDGAGTQWDPECVACFLRTDPRMGRAEQLKG